MVPAALHRKTSANLVERRVEIPLPRCAVRLLYERRQWQLSMSKGRQRYAKAMLKRCHKALGRLVGQLKDLFAVQPIEALRIDRPRETLGQTPTPFRMDIAPVVPSYSTKMHTPSSRIENVYAAAGSQIATSRQARA